MVLPMEALSISRWLTTAVPMEIKDAEMENSIVRESDGMYGFVYWNSQTA